MKRETQKEKVKKWLEGGRAITPIDSLEMFGCFRLAAIIHDLRHYDNMNIEKELVTNRYGTKFAKYRFVRSKTNANILDELNPTGEWRKG